MPGDQFVDGRRGLALGLAQAQAFVKPAKMTGDAGVALDIDLVVAIDHPRFHQLGLHLDHGDAANELGLRGA
jgi:hypothetical protein